jgi:hypothetical protein
MKVYVQFSCVKHDDLSRYEDATMRSTRCHLKGFAQSIDKDESTPRAFLSKMTQYQEIIFDGDALAEDSFTRYLPIFYCHMHLSASTLEPPALLAFKYDTAEEDFLADWHNRVAILQDNGDGMDPKLVGLKNGSDAGPISEERDAPGEKGEARETAVHLTVPIAYHTVRDSDIQDKSDNSFRDLGCYALATTGACAVVSAGGGVCATAEFHWSVQTRPSVQWFVWPLTRLRDGQRQSCAILSLGHSNCQVIDIASADVCEGEVCDREC